MKLIVGLGNPGREYENTRHNMGFRTIARLAEKYGICLNENKFKAVYGKGLLAGEKVLLVKPLTYMNNSGEAIRAILDYYKIDPADIILIYDDIDLDPGQLRIREKGTAGSHNGMKSVIQHLGTTAFVRIRVGVGAKPEGWDLADYVLAHPEGSDAEKIQKGIEKAADAVEDILRKGIGDAMSMYNKKEEVKPEKDVKENRPQ